MKKRVSGNGSPFFHAIRLLPQRRRKHGIRSDGPMADIRSFRKGAEHREKCPHGRPCASAFLRVRACKQPPVRRNASHLFADDSAHLHPAAGIKRISTRTAGRTARHCICAPCDGMYIARQAVRCDGSGPPAVLNSNTDADISARFHAPTDPDTQKNEAVRHSIVQRFRPSRNKFRPGRFPIFGPCRTASFRRPGSDVRDLLLRQ